MTDFSKAEPMTIRFPDAALAAILKRVRAYDWDALAEPEGSAGSWAHGADKGFMRDLCAYWVESYDWRRFEKALNQFPHYRIQLAGMPVHFIHARPARAGAPLVLMTHGWPGSVAEFMQTLPRLTHPEKFGGDAGQAVEIIAPSLPGYGFSTPLRKLIGPKGTADLWQQLMRAIDSGPYIAQGGDWGSVVSTWLGLRHAAADQCIGVHINMIGVRPKGMGQNAEEQAYLRQAQMGMEAEGAYLRLQMTKPQSLAHGLMDSPVGLAAWIVEKFHRWADRRDAKGEDANLPPFSKDGSVSV